MAIVRVKDAVEFNGKLSYVIDADFMPMPDGTGLAFRLTTLLTPQGNIPLCLIPWGNISSLTNDVPPEFFEQDDPNVEPHFDPGDLK